MVSFSLLGLQHPEPNGSRRATPTSTFQHRPGHPLFKAGQSIAPRGGRYRYISPTPLGIHLAVEAWTTFPDLLKSLPGALPSDGARDAYYERLQSIASNPQAQHFAREVLAFFFRLDDFIDVRVVHRW